MNLQELLSTLDRQKQMPDRYAVSEEDWWAIREELEPYLLEQYGSPRPFVKPDMKRNFLVRGVPIVVAD